MSKNLLAALGLTALLGAGAAMADTPTTYTYTANLASSSGEFAAGGTVTGTITFDYTACLDGILDVCHPGQYSVYGGAYEDGSAPTELTFNMTANIGGVVFAPPISDGYSGIVSSTLYTSGGTIVGETSYFNAAFSPVASFSLFIPDTTETTPALTYSSSFPFATVNLQNGYGNNASFEITSVDGSGGATPSGSPDSVPAPTSLLLLGAGLAGILARRRLALTA